MNNTHLQIRITQSLLKYRIITVHHLPAHSIYNKVSAAQQSGL